MVILVHQINAQLDICTRSNKNYKLPAYKRFNLMQSYLLSLGGSRS